MIPVETLVTVIGHPEHVMYNLVASVQYLGQFLQFALLETKVMEPLEKVQGVDLTPSQLETLRAFINKPTEQFLNEIKKRDSILMDNGAPMDDAALIPDSIISRRVTLTPSTHNTLMLSKPLFRNIVLL